MTEMHIFHFIGAVLPDTTRITFGPIEIRLEAGPDYPAGSTTVQIIDNRVIGRFACAEALTDEGCTTARNIVRGLASSMCDAAAIPGGAWTAVTVDTCLEATGKIRMRFSNVSGRLKSVFARHGVTPEDLIRINLHQEGYWLRLALSDVNSGLIEPKFMRSHFFRAVEALRHSVSYGSSAADRSEQWSLLRSTLDVDRELIDGLADQPERHGEWSQAHPMSSAEVDRAIDTIGEILSKYVRWFGNARLSTSNG